MTQPRIVISGAAAVTSIGIGSDGFFDALLSGHSGVCSLANRDDDGPKPPSNQEVDGLWIGAPIIGFEPKQFVKPRKALKVMCREIQTAFASAMLAIDDADLSDLIPAQHDSEIKPSEIGTVFGSEMFYGPPAELIDAYALCRDDNGSVNMSKFGSAAMRKVMPLWMLKYLPNMPACHVGIALGAHGPNNTLVLGDVSGPAALCEAVAAFSRGKVRFMLCGASGTRLNATRMNYRNDLPIANVADPIAESSRPFDDRSIGVVGGEGAAVFVLETVESAISRNAKPLAEILSIVSRFVPSLGMQLAKRTDAVDTPGVRGSGKAIALAIDGALSKAQLEANDIGMIVSHAMGDPLMDTEERQAIESRLPRTPVVVPSSLVGHTGAASGSIEILVGATSLKRRIIPPSIQFLAEGYSCLPASELEKQHVLCICHTCEGNATVTVLRSA